MYINVVKKEGWIKSTKPRSLACLLRTKNCWFFFFYTHHAEETLFLWFLNSVGKRRPFPSDWPSDWRTKTDMFNSWVLKNIVSQSMLLSIFSRINLFPCMPSFFPSLPFSSFIHPSAVTPFWWLTIFKH